MYLFYLLAAILIWLGFLSLRGGYRFASYVRRELAQERPDFSPTVSVIVPCRGVDPGLAENLTALLQQDYRSYELIFVADNENDPALDVIADVTTKVSHVPMQIIISGAALDSGQKVHNLRVGVAAVSPKSEILVFVDTDARTPEGWLRALVAPLKNEELGATTGYRWFIPVRGGLASHLRSVWNASITSALGDNTHKNFCWGGSTAIRRRTFAELQISERWQGTVSDDFVLTRVLRAAGLPIYFVPSCLLPSLEDCGFRELVEFTNRQLKITRVYASHLWQPVLLGSSLFTLGFFGGLILLLLLAGQGLTIAIPAILLAVIFALGAVKSLIRLRAVSLVMAGYRREVSRSMWAHVILWPIASLLYFYNAVAATLSRRIRWRGITYELKSPDEAVIIARELSGTSPAKT